MIVTLARGAAGQTHIDASRTHLTNHTLKYAHITHIRHHTHLSHITPDLTRSLLREVIPELQRAAASGRASEERVAAIEALAMCCFVAAEDDEVALEVMERMRAGWRAGAWVCV